MDTSTSQLRTRVFLGEGSRQLPSLPKLQELYPQPTTAVTTMDRLYHFITDFCSYLTDQNSRYADI